MDRSSVTTVVRLKHDLTQAKAQIKMLQGEMNKLKIGVENLKSSFDTLDEMCQDPDVDPLGMSLACLTGIRRKLNNLLTE